MNLHEKFKAFLEGKSDEEAIEFFGVTKQTIKNWRGGKTPGLEAVQKVVDATGCEWNAVATITLEDSDVPRFVGGLPDPTDVNPPSDLILGTEGASVVIGTPTGGVEHPLTNYCLERLMARYPGKIIRDRTVGTYIHMARNQIATRFLNSGAEWLLFVDADMVIPCGDDAFLNDTCGAGLPPQFARIDALGRMVSHRKGVVSGVYFTRDRYAEGIGVNNRSRTDKVFDAGLHANVPQDRLELVDWVGAGCLLIHRKVLETMNERFPEIAPRYNGEQCIAYGKWFDFVDGKGEDVVFCQRAAECGYPPMLDFSVVCGHIGEAIAWHHNTGANRPKRKVTSYMAPPTPITSGVDSRRYAVQEGRAAEIPVTVTAKSVTVPVATQGVKAGVPPKSPPMSPPKSPQVNASSNVPRSPQPKPGSGIVGDAMAFQVESMFV